MPENLTLTKDDLKEILKSNHEALVEVIREMKKPNEMEQTGIDAQKRDIEAKQSERKTNSESVKAEITEEEVLAISAALAAYLGVRVHIRQIRLVSSHAWAQEGRVSIQASHRLHS